MDRNAKRAQVGGDVGGEMAEIEYHLLLAEFDRLWSRRPQAGDRARMDQMMRVIEAFEERRRMASPA